jgi:mannose-6-phosphate isomerase
MAHENDLGKSELWYVLKADDGAEIVYGLEEGVTKESFQTAVDVGEIETCLHTVPVKVGDIINIPSGVVHCGVGHGVVIAEVQQNSNSTYRVFDWNRVDANGKSRPLHLKKAMDVIDFDAVNLSPTRFEEVENKFEAKVFTIERLRLDAGENLTGTCDGERFEIWGLMNGECLVNDVAMKAIQFVLLPATLGDYKFVANSSVELIKITI